MMKKRTNKTSNIANNIRNKTKEVRKKVESSKLVNSARGSKKSMSKKKRRIINLALTCIVIFVAIMAVFFTYIIIKAPKFDPNNLKFTQMSEIYDKNGNLITKMGNENRTEITYDDLPEVLIDAIIATEDSRFFQHNGFDLPRFVRASLGQVVGRRSGGASTLTMQIVKNNYTSTVSSGFEGITRKFTDIYLSIFKVERKYTKKEILEFYVNDSYLGNGAYGIEQASLNYFGKSASDLNLAEASFLAGLFQSPTYYNPYNYPERAEARRKTVLYLMQRHGYITEEEKEIALSKPITSLIQTTQPTTTYSEYQGYIDTVVEELENEYHLSPYTTPLKIYTAMNKDKQDFVNKVMNGEAWTWKNDKAQAGVVMTESDTGEVIAVGAGRNKDTQRSFNYATMTNRQIGSTAKPIFDYAPAVEYLGWGSVNYIDDTKTTYSNGKPISNSDGGYRGRLPLYQALGLSRNITALKTFQEVSKEAGNDKIVSFAKSLGISPEVSDGKAHEAHSIGSFTAPENAASKNSPMTMAGAYGAFSNGGYYIKPHTIKKFIYKDTDEVVEAKTAKTRVMNDSTAFIINYSLNWSATEGLAKSAANIGGVQTAAKTGTSNFSQETIRKNRLSSKAVNDLWVCGYTPKYALTMWYGYDKIYQDAYSTTADWTTRDRFYYNLANNLFDKDGSSFKKPSSIEEIYVVSGSKPLKKANFGGVLGYFRKGTGPTEKGNDTSSVLPNVTGITSSVSGNTVHLKWNPISAESLLNIDADDSYGNIGYDIYVKDGSSGSESYVGTTTSNSYTHTTNYEEAVYIIYTAFSNYKNNKSSGASHKVTITQTPTDFDITTSTCTIERGGNVNNCTKYIIVTYNSVDVTDEASIRATKVSNNSVKYDVTYKGKSKSATGKLIDNSVPETTGSE